MDKAVFRKRIGALVLLIEIVLLVLFAGYSSRHLEKGRIDELNLEFSIDSGFYDDSLSVIIKPDISVPKQAQIFYTLDGNDPDDSSICFDGAVILEKGSTEKVYPVKAVLYADGVHSDIFEAVYVIGDNIADRYGMYVANLSCDEDKLYDYYTGIMVPGYYYDKAIEEGIDPTEEYVGNYYQEGEEWIKDGSLTLFSSDGEKLISQSVGISISGARSRADDIKSFHLAAKDNESFQLDVFEQDKEYSKLSFVEEYNNLKLRSGTIDIVRGNIRTQLAEKLIAQSGFDYYTNSEKCVFYLNGEFYGVFDLQHTFGKNFIRRRFDLPPGSGIDVYGIREKYVLEDFGVTDLFLADLNDESNRTALEEKVDMDGYLKMYAISLLLNHTDWPENNFEAWKYNGKKTDSPYSDGRIRFLLFDFDNTFSLRQPTEGQFLYLLNSEAGYFPEVMKSEYYRNRFLVILSDLEKNVFTVENINSLVDDLSQPVITEMKKHYDEDFIAGAIDALDELKEFNFQGLSLLHPTMEEYWGLDKKYGLSVRASEGIIAHWDNVEVCDSDYYNEYYCGAVPNIEIDVVPGYSIKKVTVNGRDCSGDYSELVNLISGYEDVSIEVVAEHDECQALVIDSIASSGEADRIVLFNAGVDDINLSDYYLSDDEDLPTKYQMPDEVLKPGETATFYGKKSLYIDKRYIFGFALNDNETVYLYSDKEQRYIDELPIPRMSDSESYGRFLMNGNRRSYVEYSR